MFLSMVFISSSFLFLNFMLIVLLGEKFRPLSATHAFNFLVTPCYTLEATLWLLVIMYIARSSAKSDPPTQFPCSPNIPFIATRNRVTLSTPPCGILKWVCLLCKMYPPTLTLFHLSLISLMNSIILLCIPMFSWYQRGLLLFYLFSESIENFCCNFIFYNKKN